MQVGSDCLHLKSSERLGKWCSGSLVPLGPDMMLSASVSGDTSLARYLSPDAQIPARSVSGSCKSPGCTCRLFIDLSTLLSRCVVACKSRSSVLGLTAAHPASPHPPNSLVEM